LALSVQAAGCIEVDEHGMVEATMAGHVASFYYLKHETMDLFMNSMDNGVDFKTLLKILASAPEYDELPVCSPCSTVCLIRHPCMRLLMSTCHLQLGMLPPGRIELKMQSWRCSQVAIVAGEYSFYVGVLPKGFDA
jgi:hypothetical protein